MSNHIHIYVHDAAPIEWIEVSEDLFNEMQVGKTYQVGNNYCKVLSKRAPSFGKRPTWGTGRKGMEQVQVQWV